MTEPVRAGRPSPVLPGSGRLLALITLAAVVVIAVAAVSMAVGGPGRQVATGVVVSVEATGLTAVQGFSIRTPDGRTMDFRIVATENAAIFPPGHLAEHKVSLAPIRVTYVERGADLEAVRIEDAP
jgi:hypothetical protein